MDLHDLELKRRRECQTCRLSCGLWNESQLEIVQTLQNPKFNCPQGRFEGEEDWGS